MTLYDDAVLADTPLIYWKLAADANDSSGSSRHGTVNGSWTFGVASGWPVLGNGGTSGGNAFIGTNSTFALPAGAFTVEMWADLALSSATMLWGWSASNWDCWMNSGHLALNNGASTVNPTAGYTTTGRHHLVWVMTQGSSTSAAILYVDGVAYSYGAGLTVPTLGTTNVKVSGWYNDTGYRIPSGNYASHFAVYSGALSAARVLAHYEAASYPYISDGFADSRTVVTGAFARTVSTTGFTTEASEPLGNGPALNTGWVTFTPTSDGVYQIDTIGSSYDTALAIYTGSAIGSLTLVKADDSSGGSNNAKIILAVAAGQTRWIQVGGANGATGGTLVLNVSAVTEILADDFLAGGFFTSSLQSSASDATPTTLKSNPDAETVITGCDLTVSPGTSVALTWDLMASQNAGGQGKQVTYRIRRDNLSGTVLSSIAKNATIDSSSGNDSGMAWVSNYTDSSPTTGHYVLTTEGTGAAITTVFISRSYFTVAGGNPSTAGFTTETSEPLTMPIAATGWARFKPTISGYYTFSTVGSSFDTGLAVYSGSVLSSLTLLGSDNNSGASSTSIVTVHLTAGTVYVVQAGSGSGTATGTLALTATVAGYDGALASPIAIAGAPVVATGWLIKGRSSKTQDALAGG